MEQVKLYSLVKTKNTKTFEGKYTVIGGTKGTVVDIKDDSYFMIELENVNFENRGNLFCYSKDELIFLI